MEQYCKQEDIDSEILIKEHKINGVVFMVNRNTQIIKFLIQEHTYIESFKNVRFQEFISKKEAYRIQNTETQNTEI